MKMTRSKWRLSLQIAQAYAKGGQIVSAIKFLRNLTDCGLKEAHDAARRLQDAPDIKELP